MAPAAGRCEVRLPDRRAVLPAARACGSSRATGSRRGRLGGGTRSVTSTRSRRRTTRPGSKRPDERSAWPADLVLSELGDDPNWGGEYLVDIRDAGKRARAADWLQPMIKTCARKGFDAVEYDNLDSWTRFDGTAREGDVPFGKAEAIAFAELLADRAHALGLAVGQKNTVELTRAQARGRIGFDFAIAEECGRYGECRRYRRVYRRPGDRDRVPAAGLRPSVPGGRPADRRRAARPRRHRPGLADLPLRRLLSAPLSGPRLAAGATRIASMRRRVSAVAERVAASPLAAAQGTSTSNSSPRRARGSPCRRSGRSCPEHRRDPLAVAQVDRVAGEQQAVLAAVPQERRRAGGVAGGGDHLEVALGHVRAWRRARHVARALDRRPLLGVR